MIVCSCNVFTDHDVRQACSAARMPPRTPGQVYGCLGCSAQCGRCALTIRKIMDEALGACSRACCSGCQHSEAHGHSVAHIAGADTDLMKALLPATDASPDMIQTERARSETVQQDVPRPEAVRPETVRRVHAARPPVPGRNGAGTRTIAAQQHVHAASVL